MRAGPRSARAALAVVSAVALLAALPGCTGERTKVVHDPTGPVAVAGDEDLLLELRQNSSVGYEWRLERPVSGRVLQLDEVTVEVDDPEAAGSGATKRYRFETRDRGTEEVRLVRRYRGDVDRRRAIPVTVR